MAPRGESKPFYPRTTALSPPPSFQALRICALVSSYKKEGKCRRGEPATHPATHTHTHTLEDAMVETGLGLQPMRVAIADGQYTSTVYGWIKEGKYEDVLSALEPLVEESPDNRAGLSLLGYTYYQTGNFEAACQVYEKLTRFCPDQRDYVFYYAQCLFKLGLYAESLKAASHLESHEKRSLLLQAGIRYEEENTVSARGILDQCENDEDEDVLVCRACCLYKEEDFEGAKQKFEEVMGRQGYRSDLAYGIALCYYRMKQYGPALRHLAEIVEQGVREHPELSVGSQGDAMADARSVGNSSVLKDTALIEAFNLKGAIEYAMKNTEAAREALSDMPPRAEEELDPVTLHNQALMRMDEDPTGGFSKFNFLLKNPPAPAETFGNLLLLYCKPQYAFYDLAADVMAENAHLVQRHLSPVLYEYLDATILRQNAPEKAYQKYDLLAQRHVDLLRRLTKQIQDARLQVREVEREEKRGKKFLTRPHIFTFPAPFLFVRRPEGQRGDQAEHHGVR